MTLTTQVATQLNELALYFAHLFATIHGLITLSIILSGFGLLITAHKIRLGTLELALFYLVSVGFFQLVIPQDCPLTIWENDFRQLAGLPRYEKSFITHYLGQISGKDISEENILLGNIILFSTALYGGFHYLKRKLTPKRKLASKK